MSSLSYDRKGSSEGSRVKGQLLNGSVSEGQGQTRATLNYYTISTPHVTFRTSTDFRTQ